MKKLALAIAFACGTTVAFAQATTGTDTGTPSAKGAGDAYSAKDFWKKHSNGGYMSKEDAARFKGADGKSVDMQKLDMDGDGRVSEKEWTTYQQTAGAAGKAPNDAEHQPTSKTK